MQELVCCGVHRVSICLEGEIKERKPGIRYLPPASVCMGREWKSVSLRDLRESASLCQRPDPKPQMSHSRTLTSLHTDICFCRGGLHFNRQRESHIVADAESFMCLMAVSKVWCFLQKYSEYTQLTTTVELLLMEKHAFDCS